MKEQDLCEAKRELQLQQKHLEDIKQENHVMLHSEESTKSLLNTIKGLKESITQLKFENQFISKKFDELQAENGEVHAELR